MRLMLVAALACALAGCSGGGRDSDDDRVLAFPGPRELNYTTVKEWRTFAQALLNSLGPEDAGAFCHRLDGLNERGIMETTFSQFAQASLSLLDDMPTADIDRAGEVIKEECDGLLREQIS